MPLLAPISPVPQRVFRLPVRKHRQGGGEDVCYFDCSSRGRGFESRRVFCAPVAQLVERYLACGNAGWGLSIACSRIACTGGDEVTAIRGGMQNVASFCRRDTSSSMS